MTLVATCAFVVWLAPPAFAGFTYPFDQQIVPTDSQLYVLASGLDVNDANGQVYAADSNSGSVAVFSTAGSELANLDGSQTPAGSFGGGAVAVAADSSSGNVYVLDSTNSVVDVFDSAGTYVCQITGASAASSTECNGGAGSLPPAGSLSSPTGLTVDQATGEVYVLDPNNSVVDVFTPVTVTGGTPSGGAYAKDISLGQVPTGFSSFNTRGIAVDDANGDVYVADSGPVWVYQFDSSGAYVSTWTGSNTPAGSFGVGYVSVAADNGSGQVFVTDTSDHVTDAFDGSGNYLGQFAQTTSSFQFATAVDPASGRIYVADYGNSVNGTVIEAYGPGLPTPDVTTDAATSVGAVSATLAGTVNAGALALSDCHFEWGTDTGYGQSAACTPAAASIAPDGNPHAVTAALTGLSPGTTYHFRLVAANANGTSDGADQSFTTTGPVIDSATATNVSASSADLNAQINPLGDDTTYHLEYGTTTSYGTSVPAADADLGSGTGDVTVSQHLTGLSGDTEYHWRVVATNTVTGAVVRGGDHTFNYLTPAQGLPDNRAYELVTPPQKNAALLGTSFEPDQRIAADGNRIALIGLQCFADTTGCTVQRAAHVGVPFVFTRTTTGWATKELQLPQTSYGPNAYLTVNADIGSALLSAARTDGGEEAYVAHADGTITDAGPLTPAGQPLQELDRIAATADFSHVAFQFDPDFNAWPFDTTTLNDGSNNPASTYELSGGDTPALVGVSGRAGSNDLLSVCSTRLGGQAKSIGAMSADGSTVFVTALGGGCPASGAMPAADELYARIDGAQSVLLSGRSAADCTTATCQNSQPSDAAFWGASSDGSKAFFVDTQQLTDDATQGGGSADQYLTCETPDTGCNLYLYDRGGTGGHNLIDVSAGGSDPLGPRVQGVLAISEDGSHVYFVAKGVLTATPNEFGGVPTDGAQNLYAFTRTPGSASGRLSFIAVLPNAEAWQWQSPYEDPANTTPDGRYLVFTSSGRLTPDDVSPTGAAQVFRYDSQSGSLVRLSLGESGFNDNGNAGAASACAGQQGSCQLDAAIAAPAPNGSLAAGPLRTDPTMSDDGQYVFFTSPIGLTPQALDSVVIGEPNGTTVYAQNVYEWHDGHVSLISDGRDTARAGTLQTSAVRLLGSDRTGANVFFSTVDQLVPQDTDSELDWYDARINGGFPVSPSGPACDQSTCQGVPSRPPAVPVIGTVSFVGPGNPSSGSPPARARLLTGRVRGRAFRLRVRVPAAGKLTVSGVGLRAARRSFARSGIKQVRVSLTGTARRRLHRNRRLVLRVRLHFEPHGASPRSMSVTIVVAR